MISFPDEKDPEKNDPGEASPANLDDRLRLLVETTFPFVGTRFIRAFVGHLAQALKVRCVLVASLENGAKKHLRTLASWNERDYEGNFEIDLGVPLFTAIIGKKRIVCGRYAQNLYPEEPLLKKTNADAFVCLALQDMTETVTGVLWIAHFHPLDNIENFAAALKPLLPRLEAELERLCTEDRLRGEERRLRGIVDTMFDGVITIDEQGHIESINAAGMRIFGYERDEIDGKNVNMLIPEPYKSKHNGLLKNYIFTGRARTEGFGAEVVGQRKDGSVFPLRLSISNAWVEGKRIFIGIIRDITEQKQSEKYPLIMDAAVSQAAEMVAITNPDGEIQYVNPAFEKITGYSQQETLGKNFRILKSGRHGKAFFREMWDTINSGKVWTGRIVNKKKDGTLYEEVSTISPVRDASGNIVNFVTVKRDVTQESKLEETFRHAMKMEAIGVMVGGIAHEINQPLNAIKVTVDGILYLHSAGKKTLADDLARDLATVSGEADRIARIIERMRSLCRYDEKPKFEPIDLANAVNDALSFIVHEIPLKDITLYRDLPSGLPPIMGNPIDIGQIVVNLISNAANAIAKAGSENRVITVAAEAEKDFLILRVLDTGCGIPEGMEEQVFEPLYTSKDKGEHLGLGLAIVRTNVSALGGTIHAENRPNGGAAFTVRFPIAR